MTKVLLLQGDHSGMLKDAKITDGILDIDNKAFYTDKAVPIMLKKESKLSSGSEPLYIVKWNSVEPALNIHNKGKAAGKSIKKSKPTDLKTVPLVFPEKQFVTPEMLKKLIGMKILGNMIKMKSGSEFQGKRMLVYIVAAAGAAIVFMYMNGFFG